jgi:NAD(P)-dependent dehydrogenase (short-subunit alcohol dehydrogenase family)
MKPLEGRVAVVAGASRGAGRGIAIGLGEAGATVYAAGRTVRGGPRPPDGAPGTIDDTAEEVTSRGGRGIAVRTDCTLVGDVAALFDRVQKEQGKVDVVANAVWGGADAIRSIEEMQELWRLPFWEQRFDLWDQMMLAGPIAYFLVSCHGARLMAAAGGGLIVGVTDGIIDGMPPDQYQGQLMWDVGHHCINRLLLGMAVEGKPQGIAVITLMPGFMRTERVLMNLKSEEHKKMFRFDLSESVEYIGRAVAALTADPDVLEKTGTIHFVADLAREYGFTDVDGKVIPRFRPFD